MVEVKHIDREPPVLYDENKIKKDLVYLSAKGFSIVPYQKKIKSTRYYKRYQKRIDALFELIESETGVFEALTRLYFAYNELQTVPIELERIKYEKMIAREKKKREYENLKADHEYDQELKELKRQREMLNLRADLQRLEEKIASSGREKISSRQETMSKLEDVGQVALKIMETKRALEKEGERLGFSKEEIQELTQMVDSIVGQSEM